MEVPPRPPASTQPHAAACLTHPLLQTATTACPAAQADSASQKLKSISEYIDDTEDFINIELDYSRNKWDTPPSPPLHSTPHTPGC